ncbi:hypothetical protein TYRP_022929 [Tyrophagus putrescentiae]|nr:hypothetical protein TYRP_022929 [Tyrophagus putrescentiae]
MEVPFTTSQPPRLQLQQTHLFRQSAIREGSFKNKQSNHDSVINFNSFFRAFCYSLVYYTTTLHIRMAKPLAEAVHATGGWIRTYKMARTKSPPAASSISSCHFGQQAELSWERKCQWTVKVIEFAKCDYPTPRHPNAHRGFSTTHHVTAVINADGIN